MPSVAALFVDPHGPYADIGFVDVWDESRDARRYPGELPVVAHPPCSRWCQLAHMNQKRYGHKVGDDGGCFAAALAAVRRWGGVLEHPARTYAWAAHGLARPRRGMWLQMAPREWVTEVAQRAYGHPARKLTWLFYAGRAVPLPLDWTYTEPTAVVGWCANHGDSPLPRICKKTAARTPPAFRDFLLSLAQGAA